ncbi:hypothetical protein F2Q68_00021662 [Brassica cretica]|uniref:Uncharacterized protein n=1 Tax=Brassica cretica TaxID=69181 RepID=A0A8S9FVG3_BRACR|nr:hypothetical protein F2Q68_00021662 [Brassica cretica]
MPHYSLIMREGRILCWVKTLKVTDCMSVRIEERQRGKQPDGTSRKRSKSKFGKKGLECAMEFLEVFRDICGAKGHLELHWRSYDRFTRGISTLTRVDGRGLAYPGGLPEAGRGADAGCDHASTQVASLPWPKINIFKGDFRLFYGNH